MAYRIEEAGLNPFGIEQRKNRHENRWVAYQPGGYTSEPQWHREALREAIEKDLYIGFLEQVPDPVVPPKPDYGAPVPSRISRKKQK
jgi:hypothetical protein